MRKLLKTGGKSIVGKAIPFGIGAVIGGVGNHVLGRRVVTAARQAFETAEAERNRTLADLKTAQQAREQLRHYAPCAGTVQALPVAAGQTVAAGAPLLFVQPPP